MCRVPGQIAERAIFNVTFLRAVVELKVGCGGWI
jgi:hypothetical protein